MKTLLICIVLPVAALGTAWNPGLRITMQMLETPLHFIQMLNNTVTTAVFQLKENLLSLQYSLNNYEKMHSSCAEIRKHNNMAGVKTLFVRDRKITVYCDQLTDNGGWIVIQRRLDGSVDFFREWAQYECGFGNLLSDFWLGLDNIHYLTNTKKFILRVDIRDFDGSTAHAVYTTFNITDANDKYRLNIGGYSGTAAKVLNSQAGGYGGLNQCKRTSECVLKFDWVSRNSGLRTRDVRLMKFLLDNQENTNPESNCNNVREEQYSEAARIHILQDSPNNCKTEVELHSLKSICPVRDSFDINDKEAFSTYNRDNDRSYSNCARDRQGAWWYSNCSNSNLNGVYKQRGGRGKNGVEWYYWKNDARSFKHVEMKIKEWNFS